MALYYNLSKVYSISESDDSFVNQIATLFVSEVPVDMVQMKRGIEEQEYKTAYAAAHKIKPTLDLLGMTVAFEETVFIEEWTKREGKRKEIKETFKSLENHIEKAVKEIKKDFGL